MVIGVDMVQLSLVELFTLCIIFQRAEGTCVIPPYIRDTWLFDGHPEVQLKLRENEVIFKSPDVNRKRFECIERDGEIMLLRLIQPSNVVKEGFVCILMSEMADMDLYTIRRLNGFNKDESSQNSVMAPQFVDKYTEVTISNSCKGNYHSQLIFVKRKPPGCTFPDNMVGEWNATIPRIPFINVANYTLTFQTAPPTSLNLPFWCYSNDNGRFLLRLENATKKKIDLFMCAYITYIPQFHRYRLLILKHGRVLRGLLKVTRYLQPLTLDIDCKWSTYPFAQYYLYGHQDIS